MRMIKRLVQAAVVVVAVSCTTTNVPDLSGMSFSDEPLTGKLIWHDLITDDLEKSKAFYAALFGWRYVDAVGPGGSDYVAAQMNDVYVAGLVQLDDMDDNVRRSRWLPYMSVDDVDSAAVQAAAGGGEVVAEAREIGLGRAAAIVDPEGGVMGLARSRFGDPDDRTTAKGAGKVVWNEMLSNDPVAAAAFYRSVAGLDVEIVQRRGGHYTMLTDGGVQRAGVLQNPTDTWDPVWLTYFGVDDAERASVRAESLGATILVPASDDLREGSMAVIADPTGAVLVLQNWTM